MKKDWEIKKFEDCIENLKYTTKIPSKDYKQQGSFPIVSQEEELISGYWDNESDLFSLTKPVVIFGDHTRVLKYVDFDFVLGADGVKILQPNDFLNAKFFLYFLMNANIKNLGYARHYRLLKELKIPIPPLEEQKRIVKILDEKFAQLETIKANTQTNLQNAKDLFQSQLAKAFSNTTWEKKRLGDIITLLSGQDFPPERYNSENKGIPYITGASNFNDDGSILINRWTETPTVIAKRLDVLLVVKGSGYGKTTIADFAEAHIARQIMALRVSPDLERSFLFYYLNCKFDEIKQKGNGVIPGITRSDVLEMSLNLPPLPEQKRIIRELDTLSEKVKALCAIYEKQIADCDELKQTYLQKAFEGELD